MIATNQKVTANTKNPFRMTVSMDKSGQVNVQFSPRSTQAVDANGVPIKRKRRSQAEMALFRAQQAKHSY